MSVCLNLSCHLSPRLSSPKCENYQVTIWIIETLLRKRALLTLLQSSRIIDLVIASMSKNGSSSVKSDNPVAAVVIFFLRSQLLKLDGWKTLNLVIDGTPPEIVVSMVCSVHGQS